MKVVIMIELLMMIVSVSKIEKKIKMRVFILDLGCNVLGESELLSVLVL